MLWTIAILLVVVWAIGLVSSHSMRGLIHVLIVVAVVLVLIQVIGGLPYFDSRQRTGILDDKYHGARSKLEEIKAAGSKTLETFKTGVDRAGKRLDVSIKKVTN